MLFRFELLGLCCCCCCCCCWAAFMDLLEIPGRFGRLKFWRKGKRLEPCSEDATRYINIGMDGGCGVGKRLISSGSRARGLKLGSWTPNR